MANIDHVTETPMHIEQLIAAFKAIPTPIVGDCMQRLAGTSQLRAYHGTSRVCGRAYTVKVASGDNLYIHHALNQCSPGDIIVVEGSGDLQRALVGELMLLFAKSRGALGFVIAGAIRDADAFKALEFPCFARGHTLRGPYKNGPGAVGLPVVIDGMIVHPGDIILADEDGVIAIPADEAPNLLQAPLKRLEDETRTKAEIAAGTSDRSWVEKRINQAAL
ncbi:RraA family protein [Agrobacterium rubi]|uniref:RraA family protein n=1 Tax=Agrobacterium rubi TaxID=28099 RepID=UPI00157287E9|nr:RraA family protein [Agrobacterium rubi]NTF09541.1 RraA family protein [Agrobacterium rubi]NTF22448.1 RraA family protein [Agrobacterium rubi]NTF29305.1 RraA family protein [Agrobacterium rubi]